MPVAALSSPPTPAGAWNAARSPEPGTPRARLDRLFTDNRNPLRERVLYETCARAEEILGLDAPDLDMEFRRALVTEKGGDRRRGPGCPGGGPGARAGHPTGVRRSRLMDTVAAPPAWRPPLLWRFLQVVARVVLAPVARLRVSGDIPAALRAGPLILAANHISPADPVVLAAACQVRRVAPRIMATGGLFRAPVFGALMRASGHLRVDRRTAAAHQAVDRAADALAAGSVVLVYPEGRITLDPGLWPERGRTGTARLALATAVTVVPVAQWGSHEVLPYSAPRGALRGLARALRRRPVVRVRFGDPVDLGDIDPTVPGSAVRATARIVDALTDTLVPLRPDEADRPRYVDPSRPLDTARSHRRTR